MIAWFITRCRFPRGVHSKRLQYVRNLERHISVDIVGPCGKHKCTDCNNMLRKDYKFYLAFENSICEDYITEKVWRTLEHDVVPIVLGVGDYQKHLPPNSYIDIKDFRTQEHLASYLHILDKNDTMYNSYFKWKAHYQLQGSEVGSGCQLCEYVNRAWNKTKVYDKIDEFWSVKNMCTSPKDFYRKVDKSAWLWQSLMKTFLEML